MRTGAIQKVTIAGLLTAIGIIIPMFSPFSIRLEPASFTLASHVAIFIAMMLSPIIGLATAAGTTIGFLLGGFPIVIVLRAASHMIFAFVGGYYLKKNPTLLESPGKTRLFSLCIGLLHAVCEVLVVCPFYFGGGMTSGYYQEGFLKAVLLLVGVGTIIHSMVDFELTLLIVRVLSKQKNSIALPAVK